MTLLNTLDRWIDETPPVDQPSRFGNKAYRTWYAKLDQVRLSEHGLGRLVGGLLWFQMGQGLCSKLACLASKHKIREIVRIAVLFTDTIKSSTVPARLLGTAGVVS